MSGPCTYLPGAVLPRCGRPGRAGTVACAHEHVFPVRLCPPHRAAHLVRPAVCWLCLTSADPHHCPLTVQLTEGE